MIRLLFILFCSIFTTSFAQTIVPEKSYIHLYTDSIIYGEKVSYNTGFMIDPHFIVDSVKYKLDEVKFYKTNHVDRANIKLLNKHKSKFIPQFIDGSINLYAKEYNPISYRILYELGLIEKPNIFYINKGYNNLSNVTYNSMSEAMSDNINCLPILEEYRKVERGNRIVNTTAASILAIGVAIITFHPKYKRLQPYVIGTILDTDILPMILTPTALISFIYRVTIRQRKNKLVKKAVITYNY